MVWVNNPSGWSRRSSVVRGYQAKNSGWEAPHGCLQMWSKHVCGLSITFPQKSGSKQERPTLDNETSSGYKTLPMLFLWVFLRTCSCCKTWPFLVFRTAKEDPEEDPCDGWSFENLPFHRGLLAGMPCDVSPLNIES